jgi:hypothetical protein
VKLLLLPSMLKIVPLRFGFDFVWVLPDSSIDTHLFSEWSLAKG